tara:strand:+ start:38224 stop:39252 length:1029 start_codon:yes stop_codon:yes gene_type:complete
MIVLNLLYNKVLMTRFKRSDAILLFFVCTCLGLGAFSWTGSWDNDEFSPDGSNMQTPESGFTSFFEKALYFKLVNDSPVVHMEASQLSLNSRSKWIYFLDPKGRAFSSSGSPIDYNALKGSLDQSGGRLVLEEQVEVNTNNSIIKSKRMSYVASQDLLTCSGEVDVQSRNELNGDTVWVKSDQLISNPKKREAVYSGNVTGRIQRSRVYEEGISFASDRVAVDLNKQHVGLDGEVVMKKQALTAEARRGEIFLENYNKKLKYFALYDDVKLREKVSAKGERLERKAFAEKLEGVMSEDRIVLTGFPKVLQRGDIIKGNRITLRENNEVVEVEDANTNFKLRE